MASFHFKEAKYGGKSSPGGKEVSTAIHQLYVQKLTFENENALLQTLVEKNEDLLKLNYYLMQEMLLIKANNAQMQEKLSAVRHYVDGTKNQLQKMAPSSHLLQIAAASKKLHNATSLSSDYISSMHNLPQRYPLLKKKSVSLSVIPCGNATDVPSRFSTGNRFVKKSISCVSVFTSDSLPASYNWTTKSSDTFLSLTHTSPVHFKEDIMTNKNCKDSLLRSSNDVLDRKDIPFSTQRNVLSDVKRDPYKDRSLFLTRKNFHVDTQNCTDKSFLDDIRNKSRSSFTLRSNVSEKEYFDKTTRNNCNLNLFSKIYKSTGNAETQMPAFLKSVIRTVSEQGSSLPGVQEDWLTNGENLLLTDRNVLVLEKQNDPMVPSSKAHVIKTAPGFSHFKDSLGCFSTQRSDDEFSGKKGKHTNKRELFPELEATDPFGIDWIKTDHKNCRILKEHKHQRMFFDSGRRDGCSSKLSEIKDNCLSERQAAPIRNFTNNHDYHLKRHVVSGMDCTSNHHKSIANKNTDLKLINSRKEAIILKDSLANPQGVLHKANKFSRFEKEMYYITRRKNTLELDFVKSAKPLTSLLKETGSSNCCTKSVLDEQNFNSSKRLADTHNNQNSTSGQKGSNQSMLSLQISEKGVMDRYKQNSGNDNSRSTGENTHKGQVEMVTSFSSQSNHSPCYVPPSCLPTIGPYTTLFPKIYCKNDSMHIQRNHAKCLAKPASSKYKCHIYEDRAATESAITICKGSTSAQHIPQEKTLTYADTSKATAPNFNQAETHLQSKFISMQPADTCSVKAVDSSHLTALNTSNCDIKPLSTFSESAQFKESDGALCHIQQKCFQNMKIHLFSASSKLLCLSSGKDKCPHVKGLYTGIFKIVQVGGKGAYKIVLHSEMQTCASHFITCGMYLVAVNQPYPPCDPNLGSFIIKKQSENCNSLVDKSNSSLESHATLDCVLSNERISKSTSMTSAVKFKAQVDSSDGTVQDEAAKKTSSNHLNERDGFQRNSIVNCGYISDGSFQNKKTNTASFDTQTQTNTNYTGLTSTYLDPGRITKYSKKTNCPPQYYTISASSVPCSVSDKGLDISDLGPGWSYIALDFASNPAQLLHFVVTFDSLHIAAQFKAVFDMCLSEIKDFYVKQGLTGSESTHHLIYDNDRQNKKQTLYVHEPELSKSTCFNEPENCKNVDLNIANTKDREVLSHCKTDSKKIKRDVSTTDRNYSQYRERSLDPLPVTHFDTSSKTHAFTSGARTHSDFSLTKAEVNYNSRFAVAFPVKDCSRNCSCDLDKQDLTKTFLIENMLQRTESNIASPVTPILKPLLNTSTVGIIQEAVSNVKNDTISAVPLHEKKSAQGTTRHVFSIQKEMEKVSEGNENDSCKRTAYQSGFSQETVTPQHINRECLLTSDMEDLYRTLQAAEMTHTECLKQNEEEFVSSEQWSLFDNLEKESTNSVCTCLSNINVLDRTQSDLETDVSSISSHIYEVDLVDSDCEVNAFDMLYKNSVDTDVLDSLSFKCRSHSVISGTEFHPRVTEGRFCNDRNILTNIPNLKNYMSSPEQILTQFSHCLVFSPVLGSSYQNCTTEKSSHDVEIKCHYKRDISTDMKPHQDRQDKQSSEPQLSHWKHGQQYITSPYPLSLVLYEAGNVPSVHSLLEAQTRTDHVPSCHRGSVAYIKRGRNPPPYSLALAQKQTGKYNNKEQTFRHSQHKKSQHGEEDLELGSSSSSSLTLVSCKTDATSKQSLITNFSFQKPCVSHKARTSLPAVKTAGTINHMTSHVQGVRVRSKSDSHAGYPVSYDSYRKCHPAIKSNALGEKLEHKDSRTQKFNLDHYPDCTTADHEHWGSVNDESGDHTYFSSCTDTVLKAKPESVSTKSANTSLVDKAKSASRKLLKALKILKKSPEEKDYIAYSASASWHVNQSKASETCMCMVRMLQQVGKIWSARLLVTRIPDDTIVCDRRIDKSLILVPFSSDSSDKEVRILMTARDWHGMQKRMVLWLRFKSHEIAAEFTTKFLDVQTCSILASRSRHNIYRGSRPRTNSLGSADSKN